MQDLLRSLLDSPAFASLWNEISEDWGVTSTHVLDDSTYQLENGMISLSSQIIPGREAVVLAGAVRDAWHENKIEDLECEYTKYHPEALIQQERIRQADTIVFAIKVAWELREKGQNEMWRCLLSDREADMAQAFFDSMEQRKLNPSVESALEAAFAKWYQDMDRVTECDRHSLNLMDILLEEEEDVLSLQASRCIMCQRIESMGYQTDTDVTYLANIASDVQRDPYFTHIDDPMAQTHLSHITLDLQSVRIQDIAMRDQDLAKRLFPIQGSLLYN